MARRVIIDGSGAFGSPFLVSVAGVDAAGAQFNTLIFDGNQPPLRLWGTGFTTSIGITFNQRANGIDAHGSAPVPIIAVPSGHFPVFMTVWRRFTDPNSIVHTPSAQGLSVQGGGGGTVSANQFTGINFTMGAQSSPDAPGDSIYANYCVFKNYI